MSPCVAVCRGTNAFFHVSSLLRTAIVAAKLIHCVLYINNIIASLSSLPSGSVVPVVSGGSFFSWGTKFKYTGRTERELLEEVGPLRQEEPIINRLGSLRRKASSVPATPSSPTEMGDICKCLVPCRFIYNTWFQLALLSIFSY